MPSETDSAAFARVGIVGLGLIGGSVAKALRARCPGVVITGVDRPEVMAQVAGSGVLDARGRSLDDVLDVDLIVLSTPIPEILDLVAALGRAGARAVVTDTGSTKRRIVQAASNAGLLTFVGGHPMAGSERAGFEYARADLFEDQPWLIVPGQASDEDVLRVDQFVRGVGAVPHRVDAETHDRTMAYVSHLPQLLSVALMNAAGGAVGDDGLGISGRALGEMTRLAASPAGIWQGILSTNADYVIEAVHALTAELPTSAESLDAAAWIEETFRQAAEWRNRLVHPDNR
jgi:prephenate dehydrogenase